MRLHARAGQRGAAQAQFEALRRRLAEELGAEICTLRQAGLLGELRHDLEVLRALAVEAPG